MVRITTEAREQINRLPDHSEEEGRPEAAACLFQAYTTTRSLIDYNPTAGFKAPRSCSDLARLGLRWLLSHRYWFAWTMRGDEPVIVQVHYATSEIPARFANDD